MTARQRARLETIIVKLEQLEGEVRNRRLGDLIGEAKRTLIKADVESFHKIKK